MSRRTGLTDDDFARLLAFRDGLRRFLRWSEGEAKRVGLTAAQHQLLLAVRGHRGSPSIGEVAAHLCLRHHSAVELVDRAVQSRLVVRVTDPEDHRVTRLALTPAGERKVRALAAAHLEELGRVRTTFDSLWSALPDDPAAT